MAVHQAGIDETRIRPNGHLFELSDSLKPYKRTMAAYVASTLSLVIAYPLDSVKTRQQTYKFDNAIHCIIETYKLEGTRGFYRGLVAPLVSSAFSRSLSMTVYGISVPHWSNMFFKIYGPIKDSGNVLINDLKATPITFFSGSTAGVTTSVVSAPFEFVRISSQIEMLAKRQYNAENTPAAGSIQVFRNIWKTAGLKGLYSGWKYQILRDFFGSGIYFASYDNFKRITGYFLQSPDHPLAIAIGGAMAGSSCWLAVFPIDTFKTHFQRDTYIGLMYKDKAAGLGYKGTPSLRSILSTKMYRGLGVSIIRTSVIGAVFFSFFEYFMSIC